MRLLSFSLVAFSCYLACPRLSSSSQQDCGRRQVAAEPSRIAGGRPAKWGEFPSYVRLNIRTRRLTRFTSSLCGGTLISERHIITAAHCFRPQTTAVLAATTILQRDKRPEVMFEAARWCVSPIYAQHKWRNNVSFPGHDLALVVLKRPVKFNHLVQPACLPEKPLSDSNRKRRLVAVGLGRNWSSDDRRNSSRPERLQALPLRWTPCKHRRNQHPTKVCFEHANRKMAGDTCSGDSGGPVYGWEEDERMVVVGATSYGPRVCKSGHGGPAVYTDVYAMRAELAKLMEQCGRLEK